ncbi:hypothetical protein JW906_12730 [bacterium]|nr:hypothetical protein [bacterium]
MKKMKTVRWISYMACGLALWSGAAEANTLLSIKKGNRTDKSWAVFAFDQKAAWIGVSQNQAGKVSLFFIGNAGRLNGSVIAIDPQYDRSILVKQVSNDPPVLRADVMYTEDTPISVLKKNGHAVVAFNDERLLDGSFILYGEGLPTPGRLIGVVESPEPANSANLQFEGGFDWVGFVKSSPDRISLFVRSAEIALGRNDYSFARGSLLRAQFTQMEGEIPGLKADVDLGPNTGFSIARKKASMVLEPKEWTSMPRLAQASRPVESVPESYTPEEPASYESTEDQPSAADDLAAGQVSMLTEVEPAASGTAAQETALDEQAIPWDQKVSFQFNNTPIKDALRLVAVSNNLNMVIAEGVEGRVTINLENVTLRQAFDKIVHTNDCDYGVDGNIITVRPARVANTGGRQTKVYRLKYADAFNVAKVVKRIVTNDSLVEAFNPEFIEYDVATKSRINSNKGVIQGIRRSSVLVVTDLPEKINEINMVIAELDKPPMQILIESKLVELAPTTSQQLGIDWDKTLDILYNSDKTVNEKVFSVSSGEVFSTERNVQMGKLSSLQYAALIDFLKTKTDAKLVSNPRLLATDNEESSISVGKTVPVASIQRGMGGQSDMVTFDYKEISVRLNVTPHVSGRDEITMYVNPVIEEISDWKILFGNEAPVTDKRSVNSIVTVKNGETVVIGGLIRNIESRTVKKVFLLGSLPLIGRLFQHEEMQDTQTDLMIFITPTITPAA